MFKSQHELKMDTLRLSIGNSPLRAIRVKCYDCSGGSWNEVKDCVIPDCPLYPFRMGHRPIKRKVKK